MVLGLHGCVLGGVALRVDGREVVLRGTRRRLLVGLLLAEAPRAVDVGRIAQALWGDSPESRDPVNAVHAHVTRLRRLLHDDQERARQWLCWVPEGYALRPDSLDLWRYEDLVGDAQPLAEHDPARALGLVERARQLWDTPWGELSHHPALQDVVRRAELRHRGVEDRWAALAVQTGRGGDLADQVVSLARAEPTREQRWGLAMRALAQAGRQGEALTLYEEARGLLCEELGVDPGPELRATHRAVLRQEPSPWRGRDAHGTTRVTGGDPFVGRLEELAALDVLAARSRVVTVAGLGGLGKSRLVREWLDSRAPGGRTRWVDLRGAVEGSVVIRVATELDLALSEDAPTHALEMVRTSLRHTPTLLVVDNADTVATEVAELVAGLVGEITDLTVLVTSRQPLGLTEERVLGLAPLPSAAARGSLDGTAEELALERLGGAATHDRARAVAAVAGGLPVAIEMVAARVRQDPSRPVVASVVAGPAADPVTRAVDEAVLQLSPEAAALFGHCVHLPGGMSQRLADALLGPGDAAADIRATEARRSRVLRELVTGSLLVTTTTDRGVRYRALQPVVDARRLRATEHDAGATMHALAGWLRSRVRRSYLEPMEPTGIRDVVAEWINLEEVMRWLGEHDLAEQLDLAVSLADVWDVTGRGAEGHRWVWHALDHLDDVDPVRRARALVAFHTSRGLAYIAAHGDVVREAIALLQAAGADDTDTWAVAHAQLTVVHGWRGDLVAMEAAIAEVRAVARRAASPWLLALTDEIDGMADLPRGDPGAGVRRCLGAAAAFEREGDVDNAANATYFACALGRFARLPAPELERLLDLGTARARTTGMPKAQALVAGERARFDIDRGGVTHVEQLAAALALTEESGNLHHASLARRDLALVLLREGRREAAAEQLFTAVRQLLLYDRAACAVAVAALTCLRDGPGALRATLARCAWSLAEADGMPLAAGDLERIRAMAGPRPRSLLPPAEAVRTVQDVLGGAAGEVVDPAPGSTDRAG